MLGQYSSGAVLRADVFGHCRVGDHTEFKIGVRWGEHPEGTAAESRLGGPVSGARTDNEQKAFGLASALDTHPRDGAAT